MVTRSVILWRLTSSPARSLKILSPLHTIVMWVLLKHMHIYLILWFQMSGVVIDSGQHGCRTYTPEHLFDCLSWWLLQVPEVVRTDYQLIDISEDGFVSCLSIINNNFSNNNRFVAVVSFLDNGSVLIVWVYVNVCICCIMCIGVQQLNATVHWLKKQLMLHVHAL